jgi:hypothetical protein
MHIHFRFESFNFICYSIANYKKVLGLKRIHHVH